MGGEIAVLAVFALCVLLFLGNLGLAGRVGEGLRSFQLGTFGTLGYAFPIYLLWFALFDYINMNKVPGSTVIKLLASFFAYVSACGLMELLGGRSIRIAMTLTECYRYGADGINGGWFGGLFYLKLYPIIGVLGTYVVVIALLIISFVVATGRSFVQPLQERSERMLRNARQEREYRREAAALRREEADLARQERRQEELETRRSNLKARSLAFGEATKLTEDDEEPATAAVPVSGVESKEDVPAKKKTVTAEQIREAEEREARARNEQEAAMPGRKGKGGIGDEYLPRREKRTLSELSEMDDPGRREMFITLKKDDEGSKAGKKKNDDRPLDVIPVEPVIHMHNDVPVTGIGDTTVDVRIHQRAKVPAGMSAAASAAEKAAGSTAENTVPVPTEKSVEMHAHPAAEDYSDEDAMAGYDDFDDSPVDTAARVPSGNAENLPSHDKGMEAAGKSSAKTASGSSLSGRSNGTSAETGSIWRTGDPADGSSGVTFTSAKPAEPEPPVVKKEYQFPPISLLNAGKHNSAASAETLRATAAKLQQTLRDFGVGVTVTDISYGPTVTRYELQPDQGVKVSRIVGLQDDIKLNLAATDIRIEAPIPGKSAVGIEVPNREPEIVYLRELVDSDPFRKAASKLSFAVGRGLSGDVMVTDLVKMPHLLIAGSTGSGKSVCINTLIMSILYKAHPDDVKLILIDPKVVELSIYNGIPHLMVPVVTDPKMASGALNWAVAEMEDRYHKFAEFNVRDIKGYNQKVKAAEDPGLTKLPQLVVIVDEMADLMMVASNEVEEAICRLAQKARAAGIHLVLATQRPSVDVITGLIKANVPSRIAFAVSSSTDSRTILDMGGAEKLLGKGDMLFYPSNYPKPVRIQGAFVSDEEVESVVSFITDQTDGPVNTQALQQKMAAAVSKDTGTVGAGERDALFEQAGRFIIEKEKATIGNMQRAFRIGFNRAARIMDQLADYGVVGPDEGTKAREILMTMEEFEELINRLNGL